MRSALLKFAGWVARTLPVPIKQQLYRLGPLSRVLRQTLNRAAPTELTVVNISSGAAQGMQMRLNLQLEKDYWLGTYEQALQNTLKILIQSGMVVYDVGANIGFVTLALAKQVGPTGHVYAFEALPHNFARLQDHIALNNLSHVTTIHAAVTNTNQPVNFLVHPVSTSMGKASGSAGRTDAYEHSIEISACTLDSFGYTQINSLPDVIKLDIEGGEVLALPGMARILREARPILLLELHGEEAARVAWETLTHADYTLIDMDTGQPIPTRDALDWKAYLIAHPV